jgi:GxxExxY protein
MDPESYAVIAAALEVHRELGPGFLEAAYSRALVLELGARGVPWAAEVALPIRYKGLPLGVPFRVDLLCWDGLVVELKARPSVGRAERAQLSHYLRAGGFGKGLLLNFGEPSLRFERILLEPAGTTA